MEAAVLSLGNKDRMVCSIKLAVHDKLSEGEEAEVLIKKTCLTKQGLH